MITYTKLNILHKATAKSSFQLYLVLYKHSLHFYNIDNTLMESDSRAMNVQTCDSDATTREFAEKIEIFLIDKFPVTSYGHFT